MNFNFLTGCGKNETPEVQDFIQKEKDVDNNDIVPESIDVKVEEINHVLENDEQVEIKDDSNIVSVEEQEEKSIIIRMVGDVLLHDGVLATCRYDEDRYDFSTLFSYTKDYIEEADVAIVNQEVIIGGKELRISGYPSFNAPYEVADALSEVGFDVICHGTNHALDRGKKGIINCLNYWESNYPDIGVLGIHDSKESYDEIYIREVDGIKLAILNYTYGTNGIPLPSDMPYAISGLSEDKVLKDIELAEEMADFTIVCPHWGVEYRLEATNDQKNLAMKMTEKGADLILGTHPHVIEPIEEIVTENGNKSICYYSLGNYINWTSGQGSGVANRMVGGMSDVRLFVSDDVITDVEYDVIPLVSHVEHEKGKVKTYPLSEYTEEIASKNAIIEQTNDFSINYCKELVEAVWGSEVIK